MKNKIDVVDLMLDLGLLKISLGGIFSGGSNPAGYYPNPLPNPAGQR